MSSHDRLARPRRLHRIVTAALAVIMLSGTGVALTAAPVSANENDTATNDFRAYRTGNATYGVQIQTSGVERENWPTVFTGMADIGTARDAASRLNDARKAGETDDDRDRRPGESPNTNDPFQVRKSLGRYVVVGPDGAVVGSYRREKRANRVANRLNHEYAEIQKEQDDGVYDPNGDLEDDDPSRPDDEKDSDDRFPGPVVIN